MRLPWISRKEHDKEIYLKDHIIQGWVNKCNRLEKDIVEKEDIITNHIDSGLENALENQHLRVKGKNLEKMIEWHENNACKLNKERIRYERLSTEYKMMFRDTFKVAKEIKNEKVEVEQELAKTKGELDKVKNTYRMLTGEEIE